MPFIKDQPSPNTPTPRFFPQWMRRLNPYLKREDNNPLFEAMNRFQLIYNREYYRNFQRGCLVISALAILTLIFYLITKNIFVVIPILLIPLLFRLFFIKSKFNLAWFNPVFTKTSQHASFLTDIWLTGIKGSHIAEASLLNQNRLSVTLFKLLFFVTILFVPGLVINLSLETELPIITITIFHILTFWYMSIELFISTISFCTPITTSKVKLIKKSYRAKTTSFEKYQLLYHELESYFAILLYICLYFSIYVVTMRIGLYHYNSSPTITITTIMGLTCCIWTGIGIWLHCKRRKMWLKNVRKLLKELKSHDQIYQEYFEREFMQ